MIVRNLFSIGIGFSSILLTSCCSTGSTKTASSDSMLVPFSVSDRDPASAKNPSWAARFNRIEGKINELERISKSSWKPYKGSHNNLHNFVESSRTELNEVRSEANSLRPSATDRYNDNVTALNERIEELDSKLNDATNTLAE